MNDSLGRKLSALRKRQQLSQKDLAARLAAGGIDISNQAISKWEKGMTQPNAGQFLALCRALEVEDIAGQFLDGEYGLLRGLSESGRKKVMEYADILRASGLFAPEEEDKRGRILPLYSMAVSAGTGQFLDSSDFSKVEVDESVPAAADFGLRVAGDSMMPRYENGETVWVHSQQEVFPGEIGIFLYDDEVYMKMLLSDEKGLRLHSLNPAYPDIQIRAFTQLRVLGKVVS